MSRSAYAVYIIHPLIVVSLSVLLRDFAVNPLLKFALVGSGSVIMAFAISYFLVRLPFVKEVV
jgi:glucan biosynthesis protein C